MIVRHLILFLVLMSSAQAQTTMRFEKPIACRLGTDCAIQQYVDLDPGPGVSDFRCFARTYDGHKGTDFRIPDQAAMQAGVDVLSPAAGRVLRLRDGIEDRLGRGVDGSECGNGMVIDHGDGWESQLCHLKRGSIVVAPGQRIEARMKVGEVGLSGASEFAHVHMSVRKDGKTVDPFAIGSSAEEAQCNTGSSIWVEDIAYKRGEVLNRGFAAGAVTMEEIEAGAIPVPQRATAPALVAYVRAIGLEKDDVQKLVLTGPQGVLAQTTAEPLNRAKAQWMMFVGKKMPSEEWLAGTYRANYTVERTGSTVIDVTFDLP